MRLIYKDVSKITINRDLKKLISLSFVVTKGKARVIIYELSAHYNLIRLIDVKEYFKLNSPKLKK
ncbi:MAG: hypothetical protein ABH818_01015 [Patescibacteria group bacterium]|nr:hypothetical protein [Patescibacteria group bacterium]